VKRYKTEIVSENVILLSPAGGRDESVPVYSAVDSTPQDGEKPKRAKAKPEEDISIEDIPF
jgi:hypothetical protein